VAAQRMNEQSNGIAGQIVGALTGGTFCFITISAAIDTAIIAAIGAFIGGVIGFFVTKTLNWIYSKIIKKQK
jgi:uncharacterized protein YcfJ